MSEREMLEEAAEEAKSIERKYRDNGYLAYANKYHKQAAALRALAAEIEGLRRDAKRYRHVRGLEDLEAISLTPREDWDNTIDKDRARAEGKC